MTGAEGPLSADQLRDLLDAEARASGFLGAAKVAAFNGWTLAAFGGLSVLFGLLGPTGLVVGIGLAVVARNELVGRARLLALDPRGLELLWRNQLGLMGLIVAYCLWSAYRVGHAPQPQLAELTELLGEGTGDLVRSLTLGAYGAVIVATGVFQGLNSRYYHLRAARLRRYVGETPAWVLELQRSRASGLVGPSD